MLTKSDVLLYKEAPLHLWALKNDQFNLRQVSAYQKFLRNQAAEIETLADLYITSANPPPATVYRQPPFTSGVFHARADFLVGKEDGRFDLYEVKSSTLVKPEHILDAAFQTLIIADHHPLANIYILHINKTYAKDGEIAPSDLFNREDVTEQVYEQLETVNILRHEVLRITNLDPNQIQDPNTRAPLIKGCTKPANCPCPELCFPSLPEYPIYQLPRLGKKARSLADEGIFALSDIPDSFRMSDVQRTHVLAARGTPQIELSAIRDFLSRLKYPLHFLDYETFPTGIPLFDGYRPYEHVIFQFSLQIIDRPGSKPRQHEFLHAEKSDPSADLANQLSQVMEENGSVITWNQNFEKSRNRDLGNRLPGMSGFFQAVNDRMIDLMEVFSKGMYVHRDFKGSASLKNVVPVIVPELDYSSLNVKQGDEAMLAWRILVFENLSGEERKHITQDLLAYCHNDTEAMVLIWEKLVDLTAT